VPGKFARAMRDNGRREQHHDKNGECPFRAHNQSPWQRHINSANAEQRPHRLPTRLRLVDSLDCFDHVTGIARVAQLRKLSPAELRSSIGCWSPCSGMTSTE